MKFPMQQAALNSLVTINIPVVAIGILLLYKLCSRKLREPVDRTLNSNRVVVITGCDTGLGFQTAKWAYSWGYYVVACCLSLESQGASVLRSSGVDVIELNVCDENLVKQLVRRTRDLRAEGKVVWCLINNAGLMTYAKAEWLTWDLVQSQLLVNLSGTIQVTRSLMPFLRQSKGRVVNISSPQGLIASPFLGVYCASKWGIEAFSVSLRRESISCGVKVIIVRPCNLPHKTSILQQNCRQLRTMTSELSEECLNEYGEEIEALKLSFESGFPKVKPTQEINDHHLKDCLRLAIESHSPDRSYTGAPILVRVLLRLLPLLPEAIVDILVKWNVHNAIISWGSVA